MYNTIFDRQVLSKRKAFKEKNGVNRSRSGVAVPDVLYKNKVKCDGMQTLQHSDSLKVFLVTFKMLAYILTAQFIERDRECTKSLKRLY
jgi:hypothetical protein